MPRHECDITTPLPRYGVRQRAAQAEHPSSASVASYGRGGTCDRRIGRGIHQTASPKASGALFPLPASGAFRDLLEALDRVDGQEHPSEERGKP